MANDSRKEPDLKRQIAQLADELGEEVDTKALGNSHLNALLVNLTQKAEKRRRHAEIHEALKAKKFVVNPGRNITMPDGRQLISGDKFAASVFGPSGVKEEIMIRLLHNGVVRVFGG